MLQFFKVLMQGQVMGKWGLNALKCKSSWLAGRSRYNSVKCTDGHDFQRKKPMILAYLTLKMRCWKSSLTAAYYHHYYILLFFLFTAVLVLSCFPQRKQMYIREFTFHFLSYNWTLRCMNLDGRDV